MAETLRRISLLLALAALTTGCPHPEGGCQYGNAGGESWTGTVVKMEVLDDSQGPVHVILVEGESTEEFRLTDEVYNDCLASHDLQVGSEAKVELKYGGPCPPMKRIFDCPFSS